VRRALVRLGLATVAVVALSSGSGRAARAQSRAELEKIIKRKVLANGLEVIVVENHGIPIATVEVDVRNGSFTQTPEYAGLAHMFEHMIFKSNEKYPDPEAFISRSSDLGAIFNGSTREEVVNYFLTLPSDSLEGGVEFMAAAIRWPIFRQDEIEREREVVLGEYDRQESSPFFGFLNDMTRKLYPGQFSRKNVIGDRQVLRTVGTEKMKTIHKRYYVPNNSALIVTGDVNPDTVFRLAEKYYGDWQRAPDPFVADPVPPIPPMPASEGIITEAPVSAVTVLLQWQGPSVGKDPKATYAADVFSDALNTPGSTFQRRLVDSGLWQGVGVNYYTLNQTGPITISGQTTPEKLREALAALDAEIQRAVEPGYFTAEELKDVKAQRAVSSAFGVERTSGLTHTVGFWWSVADLEYFMGYVDNMAQQTPAALREYALHYIVGKPRVTGVLLSAEDRRRLGLTEAELAGRPKP